MSLSTSFFWFQQEKCKKLFLFFSSFKTIWFSLRLRYFLITSAVCCRAIVKHICIFIFFKWARGLVFETKYRDHRGWHTDGDRRLLQCHLQIKRSLAIDVAETRACSHAHMIMPSVGIKLLLINLTGTILKYCQLYPSFGLRELRRLMNRFWHSEMAKALQTRYWLQLTITLRSDDQRYILSPVLCFPHTNGSHLKRLQHWFSITGL